MAIGRIDNPLEECRPMMQFRLVNWIVGSLRRKRALGSRPAPAALVERLEDRQLLAATPQFFKDIYVGAESSNPDQLVVLGDQILFTADDGDHGFQIWASDGTSEATVRLTDIESSDGGYADPSMLTVANGFLFFTTAGGFGYQTQLWRTDGTVGGTLKLLDVGTDDPASTAEIDWLTAGDNLLFFTAVDPGHGSELWKSDGTIGGTSIVKDIRTGSDSYGSPYGSDIGTPAFVGGVLYFSANDGVHGNELWRSNGTEQGTVLVKDIWPGDNLYGPNGSSPHSFAGAGGIVYFAAVDDAGDELWKTDGTEQGTVLVKDIYPGGDKYGSYSSVPRDLATFGNRVIFSARDEDHGFELWTTDGSIEGTQLVRDIRPGEPGSYPEYGELIDGTFYFAADDGEHGIEPWKSDGTQAGTVLVADIYPGGSPELPSDSYPYAYRSIGGTIYFRAFDDERGVELWQTDGTTDGTLPLTEINPGPSGSSPRALTVFDGRLYLSADDGESGQELWMVDPQSSPVDGDFDGDGNVNASDIDLIQAAIRSGSMESQFDLNNDSLVNQADVDHLVRVILGTEFGDVNLDGDVDRGDVAATARGYGGTSAGWESGDFDGDARVTLHDLVIIRAGLDPPVGATAPAAVVAGVLEPCTDMADDGNRPVARRTMAVRQLARPRTVVADNDASRASLGVIRIGATARSSAVDEVHSQAGSLIGESVVSGRLTASRQRAHSRVRRDELP
jgi:ELWxxDGT repeat protein